MTNNQIESQFFDSKEIEAFKQQGFLVVRQMYNPAQMAQITAWKVNFKMPGSNGFIPHQDAQAGWNSYASFFITVLISGHLV